MSQTVKEPAKIEAQLSFPPLDENFYNLRPEDSAFFKELTGIEDDAALKQHILDVQAKAYKVAPYGCIYLFGFTRYQVLRLGRERKNAIFLDIGCCFGNVIREAVLDGFPAAQAIGSDLHQELWDLGHELFKSSPETFPAHFMGGDAFDPKMLAIARPASVQTTGAPSPDLNNLTSLNPLHGCVSAIHATSFFHLFKEDKQLHMARAFAGLLSAEPGSVIFRAHIGAKEKGPVKKEFDKVEVEMFGHNPESWISMWDGVVFEKGMVKVEAELRDETLGTAGRNNRPLSLFWSVTRL
ncbi:uncharacterized protein EDB91DRAFT_1330297 [Suillus paluster]|uniref:uncharacterized protein n=1 Tax=Suillus paluster TaxID=48578 RepID=UPI001B86442A|nr:uncharacterized protein EDB91DRAFT_1330297 [Suillus paluster]KAG1731986.1 hypothetical protein EDB91DRAFT_1330297 [Suillus paluster]